MNNIATIEEVNIGPECHGIPTVYVRLRGEGWGQSFGGLALDSVAEAHTFARSVAAVFGCSADGLVGKRCEALYAYPFGAIHGLRSVDTGRVFTISAWRKRQGHPAPTPLEDAIRSNEAHIARLRADLERALAHDPARGYTVVPEGEAP